MQSIDQEILIEIIEPPYYRGTFTDVPMDPFGIVLFGKLGKINQDLYDQGLRDFKSKLTLESIEKFSTNVFWKKLKQGSQDTIDVILGMIQEEYSSNLQVYYFLYNFFGIKCKVINRPEEYYLSTDSNREVYLFNKDNRYYPVMRQEIDGAIRVFNEYLG